jgi:hypothetical protein
MTDQPPVDAEDLAKFIRENSTPGAASSMFLRPIRQLLDCGKPVPPMTGLCVVTPSGSYPFGMLARTGGGWLCFWPIVPQRGSMVGVIDHVTLSLHAGKTFGVSHVTGYDVAGKSEHEGSSDYDRKQHWRLQSFDGTGAALWLLLLVRWDTIMGQELKVEKLLHAPNDREKQRRIEKIGEYIGQIQWVDIPLPPVTDASHFLYFTLCLNTNPNLDWKPSPAMYSAVDASVQVDGWSPEDNFGALSKRIMVGDQEVVVSVSCPPGQLRPDVFLGLPSRRESISDDSEPTTGPQ